jgi:hypothetical protein
MKKGLSELDICDLFITPEPLALVAPLDKGLGLAKRYASFEVDLFFCLSEAGLSRVVGSVCQPI